jgi:hypothetical protein
MDNLEFLQWFIDAALTWGADAVVCGGDWHDSRQAIFLTTLHSSEIAMEMLNRAFKKVYFLVGNHDLLYRNKRDITSVGMAKNWSNFQFINEPLILGDVSFFPWLTGNDRERLVASKSRYIFAHAELNGFLMNSRVVIPFSEENLSAGDITFPEHLFSGHYHFRQTRGRVTYIGNIMPFDHADDFDTERGGMFLEWGKDPIFTTWRDQPTFSSGLMSDILANPKKYIAPKATIRAHQDVDLTQEEITYLRDNFVMENGLRRFEIVPIASPVTGEMSVENETSDVEIQITHTTTEEMIEKNLNKVTMSGIDSSRLIEIFRSLGAQGNNPDA